MFDFNGRVPVISSWH